ncbi:MAG: Uma2 family endonuclease [Anaerolineae bacterium]|nr:Uma2 family endonuclease [Anaerolineae bacterium]
MTEIEYLEFERVSNSRHEFLAGEVFAMTGASETHNLINGSTYVSLYNQLRGRPCKIYPSDMRLKVEATGLYTYPDISIVCGEACFADAEFDTLINPTVIIEVLSPSTESYDRGKKFHHYRELPSLQEYALITQDNPRIERYLRQDNDTWEFIDAKGLNASLPLTSIDCTLILAEVYEQVSF